MMALVRDVMAGSTKSTLRLKLVGSMSTNTGHAILVYNDNRGSPEGLRILNNLFVMCGDWDSQNNRGWYSVTPSGFTNIVCDYNYVCGFNWAAKTTVPSEAPNYWHEAHGINGGDPRFAQFSDPRTNGWTLAALNLHLLAGSPLIGAGTNLSTLFAADADGNSRPATGGWTVGPFQTSGVAGVTPPSKLRVLVGSP